MFPPQEMFRQGDRERALGQPISPLMDRTKGGVTKSQTGFFNIVALPMYTVSIRIGGAASFGSLSEQGGFVYVPKIFLYHSLCQAFASAFPGASPLLINLRSNLDMWAEAETRASVPKGDSPDCPAP